MCACEQNNETLGSEIQEEAEEEDKESIKEVEEQEDEEQEEVQVYFLWLVGRQQ